MTRIPLPGVGQRLRLTIDSLDDEGRGVGTHQTPQGNVDVAVRGAFPGDSVRMLIEQRVRSLNLVTGRLIDLYEDGPMRTERECPHRSPCPACPLEGLARSAQLDLKRNRVLLALTTAGVEAPVADIIANGSGYGTRQRVKLVVGGKAGALRFGLYAPRSHRLIEADRCPYVRSSIEVAGLAFKDRCNAIGIAPDVTNAQVVEARAVDAQVASEPVSSVDDDTTEQDGDRTEQDEAKDDVAGLRALLLRAGVDDTGSEVVAAILQTTAALSDEQWSALVALVDDGSLYSLGERVVSSDASENSLVSGDVIRRSGPDTIFPLEGGGAVDADAFCQTDPELAARMYEMAARYVSGDSIAVATRPPLSSLEVANDDDDRSGDGDGEALDDATHDAKSEENAAGGPVPASSSDVQLEDAFRKGTYLDAYAGTGGFSQALLWLGVSDVIAIEMAGPSSRALADINVQCMVGRVDDVIDDAARTLTGGRTLLGIIADPPRKGLRKDAVALAALGAERFCLVSCDPRALAKDLKALTANGYRLVHVVPIDLFPGTPEVEAVAFLERIH